MASFPQAGERDFMLEQKKVEVGEEGMVASFGWGGSGKRYLGKEVLGQESERIWNIVFESVIKYQKTLEVV